MLEKTKQLLFGLNDRVIQHNLALIAAGVAFYAFLSIFPAIASCISIYGLIADLQSVQEHFNHIASFLPPDVRNLVESRMKDVANDQDSTLTWGLIIGLLVSLWSANKAMKAIAQGLNITFEKEEHRGIIKFNLITLGLTFISAIIAILVISLTVLLPAIVGIVLSNESAQWLTTGLSFIILVFILTGQFILLYRIAPATKSTIEIKSSLPGALFSTTMILFGSVLFSLYVANFGKYEQQYGAISAVVVTLLWLFLSAFIFLLGAELNIELRKVRKNT